MGAGSWVVRACRAESLRTGDLRPWRRLPSVSLLKGPAHMNDALAQLAEAGVSIWLDDLSRELLNSGDLQRLLDTKHIVGVTTNPTIFASALAKGDAYDEQLRRSAAAGHDVDRALFDLTTNDVRDACDVLRPIYDNTDGVDGRVSIEVDPRLARDTAQTVDIRRGGLSWLVLRLSSSDLVDSLLPQRCGPVHAARTNPRQRPGQWHDRRRRHRNQRTAHPSYP